MSDPNKPLNIQPKEIADAMARNFFGVKDEVTKRQVIRQCLFWSPMLSVLIPALFYLRFRKVGPLGWGTTVFFVVYLLLTAIGLYFKDRTDYHSPVVLIGGWQDRLGSMWLVACVFGHYWAGF